MVEFVWHVESRSDRMIEASEGGTPLASIHSVLSGATAMSDINSTVRYKYSKRFPGYRVGDVGSVWSCKMRNGSGKLGDKWRRMKGSIKRDGYRCFELTFTNGKKKFYRAHRLVMEFHIGPRPNGQVVRHLDGNHLNNLLTNLKYGTQAENMQDASNHGVMRWKQNPLYRKNPDKIPRGVKVNGAKITDHDVREMRRLRIEKNFLYSWIATMFKISRTAVSDAVRGKTWSHVI